MNQTLYSIKVVLISFGRSFFPKSYYIYRFSFAQQIMSGFPIFQFWFGFLFSHSNFVCPNFTRILCPIYSPKLFLLNFQMYINWISCKGHAISSICYWHYSLWWFIMRLTCLELKFLALLDLTNCGWINLAFDVVTSHLLHTIGNFFSSCMRFYQAFYWVVLFILSWLYFLFSVVLISGWFYSLSSSFVYLRLITRVNLLPLRFPIWEFFFLSQIPFFWK